MRLKGKVRAWGHSLGVIIPSELIKKEDIHEGDIIEIEIRKYKDIKKLYGSLKLKPGETVQKIKDELRKGWGD